MFPGVVTLLLIVVTSADVVFGGENGTFFFQRQFTNNRVKRCVRLSECLVVYRTVCEYSAAAVQLSFFRQFCLSYLAAIHVSSSRQVVVLTKVQAV